MTQKYFKNVIKKYSPEFILKVLRVLRRDLKDAKIKIIQLPDYIKFGDIKMKYLDYEIFYSAGTSLIERVRNGNMYEPDVSTAILKNIQKIDRPIICDIGSNIGLMSLNILNFKSDTTIYAFEPGEHQRKLFEKTIEFNKLQKNIKLSSIALSNENGTAEFAVHSSEHASGDGFKDTNRAGATQTVKVETKRFDDWWEENDKPSIDFMKIDTEGAELMILEGAKDFLTVIKPILLLEIVAKNLEPYDYDQYKILEELEKLEYTLKTISGTKIDKDNLEKYMKMYEEFLALPKDKI
jgi:FkbM family methyltransferase